METFEGVLMCLIFYSLHCLASAVIVEITSELSFQCFRLSLIDLFPLVRFEMLNQFVVTYFLAVDFNVDISTMLLIFVLFSTIIPYNNEYLVNCCNFGISPVFICIVLTMSFFINMSSMRLLKSNLC